MKKLNSILWGIILIAAGVIFAINALDIAEIDVFFDGWWTLFIIVPCTVGLFTEREKTGNIIGILIGVVLLLCCQDILSFGLLWKLLVPAIIIVIGIKMIFGGIVGSKANEVSAAAKANGVNPASHCATFSGQNIDFDNEIFEGAELTAVFGGVKCDLQNAYIQKDCVITVSAIFGGITILVPQNVNVKVQSNSLFGGISNKTSAKKDAVTVYVTGTCLFGGVDIK